MNKEEVQAQLVLIYERWKADFDPAGLVLDDLSPPLLLNVTEDYCRADVKIIVYGQETLGWEWNSHLRDSDKFPKYPNDWKFKDQDSFRNFLANKDAIGALCWGYEQFEFARYQPKNYRSPFWQAFRQIRQWPQVGAMSSNLVRFAYNGHSLLNAERPTQEHILTQQGSVLLDELTALKPDICIFLTGPDYDPILERLFPGVDCENIHSAPQRELARLHHSNLPRKSYRTYHPRSLRRQRKWHYLDVIRGCVTDSK